MESDLIRRDDAVSCAWKPQVKPDAEIFNALKRAIQSEIEHVPAVDAAIVIPCGGCKFWFPYNRVKGDTGGVCSNTKSICNGRSVDKDWFCADGEKPI